MDSSQTLHAVISEAPTLRIVCVDFIGSPKWFRLNRQKFTAAAICRIIDTLPTDDKKKHSFMCASVSTLVLRSLVIESMMVESLIVESLMVESLMVESLMVESLVVESLIVERYDG